jgi:hypothetical protein
MNGDEADARLGLRFWFGTSLLIGVTILLSWLIVRMAVA